MRTSLRSVGIALGTLLVAAGAWWLLAADVEAPPEAYAEPDVAILDESIRFFESKLASDPENFLAARRLVERYQARFSLTARPADLERAETLADRLEPVDRDRAAARTRIASVRLARHDFAGALRHAEAAVAANPHDAGAWSVLFDAAFATGRYERAREALTHLEKGGVPRAAKAATWLSARGRVEAASARLSRACERIETWSRPALEAWCWTELGRLEAERSGPRAAAALYAHALERVPGYRGAVEGLADLALAAGDLDEAEALYHRILTDAHADLYLRLAEIHEARANAPAARRWEREFLEVARAPGGEALFAQPLVYLLAGREGSQAEAVEVALREVRRRPTVEAWDALAWARLQAGDTEGALRASERAFAWGTPSERMESHRKRILGAMNEL